MPKQRECILQGFFLLFMRFNKILVSILLFRQSKRTFLHLEFYSVIKYVLHLLI
jgi:hypothetical protein